MNQKTSKVGCRSISDRFEAENDTKIGKVDKTANLPGPRVSRPQAPGAGEEWGEPRQCCQLRRPPSGRLLWERRLFPLWDLQ